MRLLATEKEEEEERFVLGNGTRRIERETETRAEGFATARKKGTEQKRWEHAARREKEIRKKPNEIKHRGGSPLLYRAVNEK